jgi:hypothetical protein
MSRRMSMDHNESTWKFEQKIGEETDAHDTATELEGTCRDMLSIKHLSRNYVRVSGQNGQCCLGKAGPGEFRFGTAVVSTNDDTATVDHAGALGLSSYRIFCARR